MLLHTRLLLLAERLNYVLDLIISDWIWARCSIRLYNLIHSGSLILGQEQHSVAEFRVRGKVISHLSPELFLSALLFVLATMLLALKGKVLSGPSVRDRCAFFVFVRGMLGLILIVGVNNLKFNFVYRNSCLWSSFLDTLKKFVTQSFHFLDLAKIS